MSPRTDVLSWWGAVGAQVAFAPDGHLVGLGVGEDEQILAALGLARAGEVPFRPADVRIEADEVETQGRCGPIDVRVRHTFDHTWQWRVGLTNRSDRPIVVGRIIVDAAAGPRGFLTVHAAGALAFLTFHRVTEPGCLALRLTRGELVVADGRLGTPELHLEPGARYQLTLSGDWYAGPGVVRQRYPAWFPEPVDLDAGDRGDWQIEHPDAGIEMHEVSPGRAPSTLVRAQVSDATGITRVDMAFADESGTYAAVAAAPARRGRILTAAEGLCVHRAYADQRLSAAEAAALIEDYLDEPPDAPGPLGVVLRARAHEAAGDDLASQHTAVRRAAAELAALPMGPGVPLAWLSVWAGARMLGDEPDPAVAARQLAVLTRNPGPDPVTWAEASLLLGLERDPALMQRASRELELLCNPGPGGLWPPAPDSRRARAVAVQSLMRPAAEGSCPDLHLTVRRLVARASVAPDGIEALAWLTLRAPTS